MNRKVLSEDEEGRLGERHRRVWDASECKHQRHQRPNLMAVLNYEKGGGCSVCNITNWYAASLKCTKMYLLNHGFCQPGVWGIREYGLWLVWAKRESTALVSLCTRLFQSFPNNSTCKIQ
jgi:hypothetical protein